MTEVKAGGSSGIRFCTALKILTDPSHLKVTICKSGHGASCDIRIFHGPASRSRAVIGSRSFSPELEHAVAKAAAILERVRDDCLQSAKRLGIRVDQTRILTPADIERVRDDLRKCDESCPRETPAVLAGTAA